MVKTDREMRSRLRMLWIAVNGAPGGSDDLPGRRRLESRRARRQAQQAAGAWSGRSMVGVRLR